MSAYENLAIERRDGGVAVLTVNRPEKYNTLTQATLDELRQAALELDADGDVRVVVVTGAGEKAFVAGADIREMADFGPADGEAHARKGHAAMNAIEGMGKPTIAAVNGFALGGGLELALACDIRLASENALLGLPEVGLGVIPGFGGTQRLPRVLGAAKAKELLLTGRKVGADEAERLGLVSRVVPQDKLLDEAVKLAEEIAANAPIAVRLAKEMADKGLETDLETGLKLEEKAFGLTFGTEDQKEGMKAFGEKRKPSWTGR